MSDSLVELSLYMLKIIESLLSQFKVTLYLPLGLFYITLNFLFMLKCIFSLIKSLFQLSFNFGQIVALVLESLNVFLCFLTRVKEIAFLLSKFGDHVILVSNFILQCLNLVILISLILFCS